MIAVSADRPEKVAATRRSKEIEYTLLADPMLTVARAFGVAFKASDETVRRLLEYNLDIEEASGQKHHWLPVPSVFLIGGDGVIRFVYANPDYKVRIDTEVLLAAARAGAG